MTPIRCPECHSRDLQQDTMEANLWDCLNCGLWFDPSHPVNEDSLREE